MLLIESGMDHASCGLVWTIGPSSYLVSKAKDGHLHYNKYLLPFSHSTPSDVVGLVQCYHGLTNGLLKIYQLRLTYTHLYPDKFPEL